MTQIGKLATQPKQGGRILGLARPAREQGAAASAFERITYQALAELERGVAEHRAVAGVAAAEDADPAEPPRRRGCGGVAHGLATFLGLGPGRWGGRGLDERGSLPFAFPVRPPCCVIFQSFKRRAALRVLTRLSSLSCHD